MMYFGETKEKSSTYKYKVEIPIDTSSPYWGNQLDYIEINNVDFDMLIDVLDTIDDDGCKLRYASDGKGNDYNEKPCFIRADLILDTTKELYSYLINEID